MEKFVVITYLFDFYQNLLTEKQRELLKEYYFEDLSLGELALQHQITRQSAFDTIKKAEQKLLDYEEKLSLFSKYQTQQQMLRHLKDACIAVQEKYVVEDMGEVVALVDSLMNKM